MSSCCSFSAGISIAAMMAVFLFLFVVIMVRRFLNHRQQADGNQPNSGNIYSIFNPNRDSDYVNVKLPYLPDYSPPMNPPSYDDIGRYETLGRANTEEPPIYEEIGDRTDSHVYENLPGEGDGGYVNTAFTKSSHEMEYMKI